MGKTELITSSEMTFRQSTLVETIGSLFQWFKGQYNPWPCVCTQRSGRAGWRELSGRAAGTYLDHPLGTTHQP